MSRRPGIGSEWYDRYSCDAFPSDFLVVDGSKRPVPRYYTNKLEEEAKKAIKDKRKARAEENSANSTPERLAVREEVLNLKVKRLEREMDRDS